MNKKSILPMLWGDRHENDVFRSLHREVDQVFDEFHRGFHLPAWMKPSDSGHGVLSPHIDVSESETEFEVTADLPGVEEKDVSIEVAADLLTIGGEKETETEEAKKNYHRVERSHGSFKRTIRLPFSADADKTEAKFVNGVLTVKLPKPPEAKSKTRKIELSQSV